MKIFQFKSLKEVEKRGTLCKLIYEEVDAGE